MLAHKNTLPESVELFLLIQPAKIAWLRFVLEGYDGLAVLTTISVQTGLVRIRTLRTGLNETMRLLDALAQDLAKNLS